MGLQRFLPRSGTGQNLGVLLPPQNQKQVPSLNIPRSKQGSVDFQTASGMGTNSSQRAQSSIFQQQKAQTSLNSTVSGSNFASNQVGKENLHTQDHQMKMLSARPVTEINGSQPMVYGNMQPKTDFMQSSKTQMLNLKESSHSKLSTTNSVTR